MARGAMTQKLPWPLCEGRGGEEGQGSGLKVQGSRFRVQGGFRVHIVVGHLTTHLQHMTLCCRGQADDTVLQGPGRFRLIWAT